MNWPSVSIKYRYKKSSYNITIFQVTNTEESWWKEGENQGKGDTIKLVDDGIEHNVEVHIRNEKEVPAIKTEYVNAEKI